MPNWKKLIVSGSDAHLSSLDISGALTASSAYLISASIGHLQTIYETASVIYSSGSTKFGDTPDDTHEITGSLLVNGSITGDLTGTSSYATTASHALNVPDTASHALTSVTSSYSFFASSGDGVFTGSFSGSFIGDASHLNVNPFPFTGSGEMQGKLTIESFQDYADEEYVESYFAGTAIAASGDIALTGSIFSAYINGNTFTGSLLGTASYAETASYLLGSVENAVTSQTASFIETAQTASFVEIAQTASFIEIAQTASFIETAQTASFVEIAQTASYYNGSVTSASLAETASYTPPQRQLIEIISSDITCSLYTTHIISSSVSMSFPTSPEVGDWLKISQRTPSGSGFEPSLLFGNGSQIMSSSTELELDVEDQGLEFIYADLTQGWIIIGN